MWRTWSLPSKISTPPPLTKGRVGKVNYLLQSSQIEKEHKDFILLILPSTFLQKPLQGYVQMKFCLRAMYLGGGGVLNKCLNYFNMYLSSALRQVMSLKQGAVGVRAGMVRARPLCALMQRGSPNLLCSSNNPCLPTINPLPCTHSANSIVQVFTSVPEPISEICHLNAAWNVKGEKEMTHQRRSPPHLRRNRHQEIEQSFWVLTLISQPT